MSTFFTSGGRLGLHCRRFELNFGRLFIGGGVGSVFGTLGLFRFFNFFISLRGLLMDGFSWFGRLLRLMLLYEKLFDFFGIQ